MAKHSTTPRTALLEAEGVGAPARLKLRNSRDESSAQAGEEETADTHVEGGGEDLSSAMLETALAGALVIYCLLVLSCRTAMHEHPRLVPIPRRDALRRLIGRRKHIRCELFRRVYGVNSIRETTHARGRLVAALAWIPRR